MAKLKKGFSDKAWVHLDGYINIQNHHLWDSENSHAYVKMGLHSQKIVVWCAVSQVRVVGPFFFLETITVQCYQRIIELFIAFLEPGEHYCWLRDRVEADTAGSTMQFLNKFF